LKRSHHAPLEEEELEALSVLEVIAPQTFREPPERDPLELRNAFLALRQDTVALVAFLNKYGMWDDSFAKLSLPLTDGVRSNSRDPIGTWHSFSPRPGPIRSWFVSADYFWHYRALLRQRLEAATKKPADWFSATLPLPALECINEYPFQVCRMHSVVEAIEISFGLEFLKDGPFALCARVDCRKLFCVTRKGRIYCEERCGRIMVTRRSRAPKKNGLRKGQSA